MNSFIKRMSITLSAVVLSITLLLSVSSVQAEEKVDIKTLTAFMVEQNTQQVNQQLSQQLNNDIQFSVMMKLPTVVNKENNSEVLIARTVVKNNSQINGE
ncbi:MAG: hypothetical protein MJK12_03910 [Colwellia sp.]|nr:hypothetical protein [Colwellia sp.]